jgi:hypothetical protein
MRGPTTPTFGTTHFLTPCRPRVPQSGTTRTGRRCLRRPRAAPRRRARPHRRSEGSYRWPWSRNPAPRHHSYGYGGRTATRRGAREGDAVRGTRPPLRGTARRRGASHGHAGSARRRLRILWRQRVALRTKMNRVLQRSHRVPGAGGERRRGMTNRADRNAMKRARARMSAADAHGVRPLPSRSTDRRRSAG